MGNHLSVIFLKSTYGHYVLQTEMTAGSMSYAIQPSTTWCSSCFSLPFILILSIIPLETVENKIVQNLLKIES